MATTPPLTLGTLRRNFCGIPQRPRVATPEMITIAERITQLYAQVRREQNPPEDVDAIWIQDAENEALMHFVNFAETGERIPRATLQPLIHAFRSRFDNPEDLDLIQRWASMCGYELRLITGTVRLIDACPHA